MTMRKASILSKGRTTGDPLRPASSAFTSATTSVDDVYQRRNTAFPRLSVTPLTNLPVAASDNAVTGLFARPSAHGQFRLMPVPSRDPEWNARIAVWARS